MIEHGSIEVITTDGTNYGAQITPLFPFDKNTAKTASQVKARTGIQLGAKGDYPVQDGQSVPASLFGGGQWSGTTAQGVNVTVRIWQTAV